MCCGKISKAVNIARGYSNLLIDKIILEPAGILDKNASERMSLCDTCEKQTWMMITVYAGWLEEHGGEVLKNFEDLTKLPELPKQSKHEGAKCFCMLCKCHLPAKVRVEEEKCPLGKW